MKGEGEDRAEKRARELVVNASPGDDDVNDKRFEGCIGKEEQRRGHAVNEGLANDQRRADRPGIKPRHANAEQRNDFKCGVEKHRYDGAQSFRNVFGQNVDTEPEKDDYEPAKKELKEPQHLFSRLNVARSILDVEVDEHQQQGGETLDCSDNRVVDGGGYQESLKSRPAPTPR